MRNAIPVVYKKLYKILYSLLGKRFGPILEALVPVIAPYVYRPFGHVSLTVWRLVLLLLVAARLLGVLLGGA